MVLVNRTTSEERGRSALVTSRQGTGATFPWDVRVRESRGLGPCAAVGSRSVKPGVLRYWGVTCAAESGRGQERHCCAR